MTERDRRDRRSLVGKVTAVWVAVTVLLGLLALGIRSLYSPLSGQFLSYLLIYGVTEIWMTVSCVRTLRTLRVLRRSRRRFRRRSR